MEKDICKYNVFIDGSAFSFSHATTKAHFCKWFKTIYYGKIIKNHQYALLGCLFHIFDWFETIQWIKLDKILSFIWII